MREPQLKVPFDYIVNKFKDLEPSDICERLGINFCQSEQCFTVKMMSEDYKVYYPSGEVKDSNNQNIPSYILKTILIRYLVNGTGSSLTGEFVSYKEIEDGSIYYPNFYSRTILRLAKLYDKYPDKFLNNSKKLNVQYYSRGSLSFSFEFIKDINFLFILYEGDEEFSASANILMDKNTETYFNAEDLAVVVDVAIEYFIYGYIPKKLGMYDY